MIKNKRLAKELEDFRKNPPPGCQGGPINENDLNLWEFKIPGPEGTPYEGGIFICQVEFTNDYPFSPPKAKFVTQVFHPNVNIKTGDICMDVLKDRGQWSAAIYVSKLIIMIQSLLADPNPSHTYNPEATAAYNMGFDHYSKVVKDYVKKYASK